MIDIKTLLPEVKKLLPGVSDEEIITGINEFTKAHPDFDNQKALQALTAYLEEQQPQPQQEAAPSAPPFQNLLGTLGAK